MSSRVYQVVLWLALPLVWLRLQWRARREAEYGQRQGERFGRVPADVRTGPIWFHTVSAGESIAAAPLVQALMDEFDSTPFLVTTMTPTGSQQVVTRLEAADHCYAPYDFGFAVRRFYALVRPRLLVLMETELWPNLIAQAHRCGVPVLLVNARLSARSAAGYARVGRLTARMLTQVDFIACQSQQHANRFVELGAAEDNVAVMGSVKFDVRLPSGLERRMAFLRAQFGLDDVRVWIAASTHPGEDEIVLDCHAAVRGRVPGLRLILVPRHPVRVPQVIELVEARGWTWARQSEPRASGVEVIIGDVMGTLFELYSLAQVAFVGGSFVPVGGHNPIEPALCQVPVVCGPHQFNFTDVMATLQQSGGLVTVQTPAALAEQVALWLTDPDRRISAGRSGAEAVIANRGATERVLALLRSRILLAQGD